MIGGDPFKIVFDTMEAAKTDLVNTANQHTQSAGDQLNRMMSTRASEWFDEGADEAAEMYGYAQKQSTEYADRMTHEGINYGHVGENGRSTLSAVKAHIRNIG